MQRLPRRPFSWVFVFAALLAACTPADPVFHSAGSPTRLSDWQLFTLTATALTPVESTLVFTPANQLFTDYAQKLRTLWMPNGVTAQLVDDEIEYPVGTILSKTFYYPVDSDGTALQVTPVASTAIDLRRSRLVETRLLVRRESGWSAFPYVWNDEQTEAFLRVAGSSKTIALDSGGNQKRFTYFVPNENQCAGCHVTRHPDGDMHPLAATARQLRTPFDAASAQQDLQILELERRGWLAGAVAGAPTTSWLDATAPLAARANAYLAVHCGHCHNPEGAADTSALLLDGSPTAPVNMGVCKPPVAAGGGAGDRLFSIVPGDPARSILLYRMESVKPDEMMPELGRSLVHEEGVQLISQWIAAMPGDCPTPAATR